MEINCVQEVKSSDEIIEEAYFAANPDVKKSGMSARYHFDNHGKFESVRVQYLNVEEILKMREEKLSKLEYANGVTYSGLEGYSADMLADSEKDELGITSAPPISCNQYSEELVNEFRDNPDQLYLDVGAGLRSSVFSNVVNIEIFPFISTDVVCMGERLPFADNQFDKIICFAVLEHTKKPWLVAEEMCRVLKPGGKLEIDYPFLQPVHGYPHHYFNATPTGNCSLIEDHCIIDECEVQPHQSPIFSLCWFLNLWVEGLSDEEAEKFKDMTLHELLSKQPFQHLNEFYCSNLDKNIEKMIPAGTTIRATKK